MSDNPDGDIPSIDYRIRIIFNDKTPPEMKHFLREFLHITGLDGYRNLFNQAMYLAQHPDAYAGGKQPELDYAHHHLDEFDENDPPQRFTITPFDEYTLAMDASPVKDPSPARQWWRLPRLVLPDRRKWRALPAAVKHIIIICGLGAVVQGIDEAVVNGAQGLYLAAFGIPIGGSSNLLQDHNAEKAGLINAAPYLCCVLSCWFTPWLNRYLGRRGTICLCALFSIAFPFAQAFAQSWPELALYRLCLGLGIGPKSATIPIYAAETAPANIRGSLVTSWQASTALGIAIGCAFSVLLHQWGDFRDVDQCNYGDLGNAQLLSLKCSWNWRVILLIPMFPPMFLAVVVYFCRESPRWTVTKAHRLQRQGQTTRAQYYYREAFTDLKVLSRSDLLAARDMFIHFFFLRREYEENQKARDKPHRTWIGHKMRQLLFSKEARRNRRSIIASTVCMVAQQLCGVNVLIYYSNHVLSRVGEASSADSEIDVFNQRPLLHTMGFGLVNFFFALPAFLLIDMMGRRTLLLGTFPLLCLSHLIMACSSASHGTQRVNTFLAGYYLFGIFYSPGEGPVPFVYASESMPLSIREEGMGLVTSINWLLNWLVAFIAPYQFDSLGMGGTFALYAAFCFLLFFVILLLVPETRLLTLEQLDYVFNNVKSGEFARHAVDSFRYRAHFTDSNPGSIYDKHEDFQNNLRRERTNNVERGITHDTSSKPEDMHIEMTSAYSQTHTRERSSEMRENES